MDLFELAKIKCISEANNTTPVDICIILVLRMVDLIKIAADQPFCIGGLLINQLLEEGFLKIASRQTINGGELEGCGRGDNRDIAGEVEGANAHTLHIYDTLVP